MVLILFVQKESIAQKIDTIVHANGNILTGDLKKMAYGVVTWSMTGMGTISLEEVHVSTIKSDKLFEIKMKNGFIYFGSFDTSYFKRKVNIVMTNKRELVEVDDIVEIYPIRRNFWMRTSGNFSLGLNYSKGSDIGTIVLSGDINYRKKKSFFEISWDDHTTYQADTLNSTKVDGAITWERYIKKRWSSQVIIGATQNSELGTKLRLGLSVLGLRDLAYNNWNRLYAGAGLSLSNETPYDDSGDKQDIAGIVSVAWKVYKYTIPKVWVDADVSLLPYITNTERIRAVVNLAPKISIVSDDLKLGFRFYYSFDSKPPTEASSNDDYGMNLEITYSLH